MPHKNNDEAIDFSQLLLPWFDQHGRKSLPWQQTPDPYAIWISEIMLQQTQVETVIPYYQKFMARFPTCTILANGELDEVMTCWAGLGYYARARNLHRAAQLIRDDHNGVFPFTLEHVMALPGIGRSTAGAILAFSSNARHPILDGNVKRVLTRFFAIAGYPGNKKVENRLWQLAEQLTPGHRIAEYTQAIMDLGATVCKRNHPRCPICPLRHKCVSLQQGNTESYPAPKPASRRPRRQSRMLLLESENTDFLLVKRPPSGIWGGMWVFPEISDIEMDYRAWCDTQLGLNVSMGKPLATVQHGFTHFELEIQPILCRLQHCTDSIMDSSQYLWYNPLTDDPVAIPAAVRKIFKLLETGATTKGDRNESNDQMRKTG